MKNEKPKNQPELRTPTVKGKTIALKNLRPGDWLEWGFSGHTFRDVVVKNETAKGLIHCLDSRGPYNLVHRYVYSTHFERVYLGRGLKRKWLNELPKWIANQICPYSGPVK